MSDQAFSAMDTLDYYQRVAKANGGMDKVQNWSRIFLARSSTSNRQATDVGIP
jgi:hypothetical protein